MTYQGELVEETAKATRKSNGPRGQYKPSTKKQIECTWWPDKKPGPSADRTGYRNGRLTVDHPVFFREKTETAGRKWYYTATCDCGGEITYCNLHQTKSCGCLRVETMKRRVESGQLKKRRDPETGLPILAKQARLAKFNRIKSCTRKENTVREVCKHYAECLGYRVGLVFDEDGNRLPDRYAESNGNCYSAATAEDLKYYSTLARLIG
jgi:hypothetical protein